MFICQNVWSLQFERRPGKLTGWLDLCSTLQLPCWQASQLSGWLNPRVWLPGKPAYFGALFKESCLRIFFLWERHLFLVSFPLQFEMLNAFREGNLTFQANSCRRRSLSFSKLYFYAFWWSERTEHANSWIVCIKLHIYCKLVLKSSSGVKWFSVKESLALRRLKLAMTFHVRPLHLFPGVTLGFLWG